MFDRSRAEALDGKLDAGPVLHPATSIHELEKNGPLFIESGRGCHLTTPEGRALLDGAAGLWCANIGYGRREIGVVAAREMEKLGYAHTFSRCSNRPQVALAERILSLLNRDGQAPFATVFFGCTGSDANETQIKLSWLYHEARGFPGKKTVISRWGSYHGTTVATSSLTGIGKYHQRFGLPLDFVRHVSCPHPLRFRAAGETTEAFTTRLAEEVEDLILAEGPETVAAFIAEPVTGAGGVVIPPETYFPKIAAVLRKYDVLFLVDEVVNGFGRLGTWFGTHHFGLEPDMVAFAKGLTSAYFPLSAVAVSEKVHEVLRAFSPEGGTLFHGLTYSGHPVGTAIGLEVLDIIEREGLVENAVAMGALLRDGLRSELGDHPNVADIRGLGLLNGVEFTRDRETLTDFPANAPAPPRIVADCLENGLMLRALSWLPVVAFSPPLTITRDEVERIVSIFSKSVRRVLG